MEVDGHKFPKSFPVVLKTRSKIDFTPTFRKTMTFVMSALIHFPSRPTKINLFPIKKNKINQICANLFLPWKAKRNKKTTMAAMKS